MKTVEAVKNLGDVALISRRFHKTYSHKIGCVWDLGLELALRISDLLDLKYSDIDNGYVTIVEAKTSKASKIKLNPRAVEVIDALRVRNPNDDYLFQANGNRSSGEKPFSRQYITKAFGVVAEDVDLLLGTHSMRKTRGYHLYKQTNDVAKVSAMLQHSSTGVTLRYIGITQEDRDNDFDSLSFG
jgi:integrase